jgi:hypothetical protein
MHFTDDRYHLRVELQAKECSIPEDERVRLQNFLVPLGEAVQDLAASDLAINVVHHPATQVYHIELKLKVPGQTLLAVEKDPYLDSALQRGLRQLVRQVETYQSQANGKARAAAEQRSALQRDVVAPEDPNTGPLAEAVRTGDYRAFRAGLGTYEAWIAKRVGRWVQRYPQANAQIGDKLRLGDLVEAVYLQAFERFGKRSTTVRLSEWLEGLIDPALRTMLRHPSEEQENVSLARTVRERL